MASQYYLKLKELSEEELLSELEAAESDYHKARFDHAVKGLDNPILLRDLRKDVARIKTHIRARELAAMSPAQLAKRSKIRARRRK